MINSIKDKIPAYDAFTWWFSRAGSTADDGVWKATNKETGVSITYFEDKAVSSCTDNVDEIDSEQIAAEIYRDFQMYKDRPEYFLDLESIEYKRYDVEDNWRIFSILLAASLLKRRLNRCGYKDNIDEEFTKINRCLDWLYNHDFHKGPASSMYHESFDGGLCYHSLRVADIGLQLRKLSIFGEVLPEDIVLVALCHDWCKIGMYESFLKNVKDDETGAWEKQKAFKRASVPAYSFGHGESSLYIAQNMFKLSLEEALAIRWHMGAWYLAGSETDELQSSNERYPIVHLLQFADQLSITRYC